MRYAVGVLCLLGSLALLYAGLRPPPKPVVPPTPDFTIDTPVKDFGEVDQFSELRHTFTLTNTHPEPVEVLNVMKSCGCTVAEISPKLVPPGGMAELKTVWKVGLSRGHKSVNVGISYSVGDGTARLLYFTHKATVVPDAWLQPGEMRLRPGVESDNDIHVCFKNNSSKIGQVFADPKFFVVGIDQDRKVVSCRYNGSKDVDEKYTYNVLILLEGMPGELVLPVTFSGQPPLKPMKEKHE